MGSADFVLFLFLGMALASGSLALWARRRMIEERRGRS